MVGVIGRIGQTMGRIGHAPSKGGGAPPPPDGFSFVTTNNGSEPVTAGGEPVYARNT